MTGLDANEVAVERTGHRHEPGVDVYTYRASGAAVVAGGPPQSKTFRQIVPDEVTLTVQNDHMIVVVNGPLIQGTGESWVAFSSLAIGHAPLWLQTLMRSHLPTLNEEAPSSARKQS